jgi:hypothetical protein
LAVAGAACFAAGAAVAEPRLLGGVRVGATVADIKASQEADPRFGVDGGVYVEGDVWKVFSLRLEANYVQKGARMAYARTSIEWQMDYLEVPLLLVYNIMPRSQTSVELYGGAAYGFGIQQQVEQGDNIGYDVADYVGEIIYLNPANTNVWLAVNDVETSEWSFLLGMGLSVPVGAVNFMVDARFTGAITDPVFAGTYNSIQGSGSSATQETVPADFSNKTFTFYIGFEFPFGNRSETE